MGVGLRLYELRRIPLLETVRKGVRGNAPSMDLSGIRTIERAQRSLLASRRPTSRAYPRLFGQSQKVHSPKFGWRLVHRTPSESHEDSF